MKPAIPGDDEGPPLTSGNGDIVCPGCGGRNAHQALECDWCAQPFVSQGRRLQLAGWHILSAALLLVLIAAVVALAVLNAGRPVGTPRPALTVAPASSPVPTPAVTPRVTEPATATAATAAPATPAATPAPPPRKQARVSNTGGVGVVVRADAGPQGSAVGNLREGTLVLLTGREQSVGARSWREIEDPVRGVEGWVSSEYLDPVSAPP